MSRGLPDRRMVAHSTRLKSSHREPLYIVDGLPLSPQAGGTLLGLDPYDIAKIEILTDPADLVFHGGSRAAAGIVRIKTKL